VVAAMGEDDEGDVADVVTAVVPVTAAAVAVVITLGVTMAAFVVSRKVDIRLWDRFEEVEEVEDFLERTIKLEGPTGSLPSPTRRIRRSTR